jgi:predicted ArsR family transcriptional regulator
MTSQLYRDIQQIIQQRGEINGMEELANIVDCHNHAHVRKLVRQLEALHIVRVIRSHGGRGRRTRIINRNSPGYQRKVKR